MNVLPAHGSPKDFVARPVHLTNQPSVRLFRDRRRGDQHPHILGPPLLCVLHSSSRQLGRRKRPHTRPRESAQPNRFREGTPVDLSQLAPLRH
eukprot:175127-Rhodomonas_salina.2